MMALQPFLAVVRPQKGSALRTVWYLSHWTLGMAAVALGWWNCYTGLQLYTEEWATDTTVRALAGKRNDGRNDVGTCQPSSLSCEQTALHFESFGYFF